MNNFNLNFLIVEDDLSYSIELRMLVEELGYNVLAVADNSGSALEVIYAQKPDFILMDNHIKGQMTGLDIAEAIKDKDIPILFITSFKDEAAYLRAEATQAIGYLIKPIDAYSLKSAIRLAVKNMYLARGKKSAEESNENQFLLDNYLFFKKNNTYHKVDIADILLLESEKGGYTTVYTDARTKFVTRNSLAYFEEYLPEPAYLRVHRSYILQLNKIESIDFHDNIIDIAGKQVPMSRNTQRDLSVLMQKVV